MEFVIGTVGEHDLLVDPLKLVNSRAIIQANSGGGKSWLFRVIAEQCAGKIQTVIIDPEGEFSTLREKFDFALIGRDGEMPIDLRSAALLARKLIELNISAIVNLSDLDDLESKREYLSVFLTSLMGVPQAHWHPVLILIDEAHKFCPEVGTVKSTRAVITLMDSGRKRGFAGLLATQRLSKLHKDAAAEANNVFVGRTWLDLDQERAGDLLGMRKADRTILRDLQPGQFYAFGPALQVDGVCCFQSAPVQTTHPKPGERHSLVTPRASEAISEVVRQIGDLPEQAKQEQDRLMMLERENAQLRQRLAERATVTTPPVVERVEIPILQPAELETLNALPIQLSAVAEEFSQMISELTQRIVASGGLPQAVINASSIAASKPVVKVEPLPIPKPSAIHEMKLPRAEKNVLTALAQYPQGRTKVQVAILTGYAVKGGGFNNAIGALRSARLLTGSGDNLSITEAGLIALGNGWKPLPTGIGLYQHWYSRLAKAERSILAALVQVWPEAMTKEALASATGYEVSGGGFNNALGKLRTLELISRGAEIKASDDLF